MKKVKEEERPIQGMDISAMDVDVFGLFLNGELIVTSICYHNVRKTAQAFDRLRHLGKREAMHCLTQDMGFCDNTANRLFLGLHGSAIKVHTH